MNEILHFFHPRPPISTLMFESSLGFSGLYRRVLHESFPPPPHTGFPRSRRLMVLEEEEEEAEIDEYPEEGCQTVVVVTIYFRLLLLLDNGGRE